MLPDFDTRQKEVLSMGHAFLHFSYRALLKFGENLPFSIFEGKKLAQRAISELH